MSTSNLKINTIHKHIKQNFFNSQSPFMRQGMLGVLITVTLTLSLSGCGGSSSSDRSGGNGGSTETLSVTAGDHQAVNGSTKVELSASSNDSSASFVWSLSGQPDASVFDNDDIDGADKSSASFTPDVVGTYYFDVEASSGGETVSDTTQVTVDNVWQPLTDSSFSAGAAEYASMVLAASGTPYVAYSDGSNNDKATVRKFNGTSWETVGNSGFSSGSVIDLSIMVAPDGTLYAAYGDSDNNNKATVKQFNNHKWVDIGTGGVSATAAYDTTLAVAPNGRLYLAYADNSESRKLTVKSFDRNAFAWTDLGDAGFSAGQARSPSLKVARDGTPYVVYQDGGNGDKATVKKFVGSHYAKPSVGKNPVGGSIKAFIPGQWETVGSVGFSEGKAAKTSLTVAQDGTLFVAYQDGADDDKVTVKTFTDSQWGRVGGSGVSNHPVTATALGTATDGSPYVAYQDGGKLTVKGFFNNTWELVGGAEFTASGISSPVLAKGPDGTPYIAYTNTSSGNEGQVERLTTINPQITRIQPGKNAPRVTANSDISVRFDRPMAENTLTNPNNFKLTDENGEITAASMTYDTTTHTETFVPKVELSGDVSVALSNGITDIAGNALGTLNWDLRVPSWQTVGLEGISESTLYTQELAFAMAPDGTPYVAYTDKAHDDKTTVKRFNGNDWVTVGSPGFSDDRAFSVALAIAPNGAPHILFADQGRGDASSATVMRFNDTSWEVVGERGISTGRNEENSLAFAPDGTLYVAYKDGDISYVQGNDGKLTVKRYNSTNDTWQGVGFAGFSAGSARYPSLAFAPDGTPHVAYRDGGVTSSDGNDGRSTVMRYDNDNNNWQPVGTLGFSVGAASYVSLVFAPDGAPHVAYKDAGYGNKATVMQYDGSSWSPVGASGFSAEKASFTSLALAPDGTPYVAYRDEDTGNATLMQYNGNKWETAGPSFSMYKYGSVHLAVAADGTPFTAFSDDDRKATVFKNQ